MDKRCPESIRCRIQTSILLKLPALPIQAIKHQSRLASRGLGSLSPDEKASAGKLIGDAKAAIAKALADATEKLEAERDAKVFLKKSSI